MRKISIVATLVSLLACVVFLLACAVGHAAESDADKAVDLVKKGVHFYQANGAEKALEEFVQPKGQFNQGALYIFVYDQKATMLAHPNNALIGQNLFDVADAEGKYFRREIVNTVNSKGSGWTDYKYKNPKSNQVEHKTTFCEKADELILCCGIYKK